MKRLASIALIMVGCASTPVAFLPEASLAPSDEKVEVGSGYGSEAPPTKGPSPWRKEQPTGKFLGSTGQGEFSWKGDQPGTALDDDTDAYLYRLFFDGKGGGVNIEWLDTDGDLFGTAEARTFDIFGFGSVRIENGPFHGIIRVGGFLNDVNHRSGPPLGTTEPFSYGVRVEFAPEVDLVRRRGFALTIFANLSVGYGWAIVDLPGDDVHTRALTLGGRPASVSTCAGSWCPCRSSRGTWTWPATSSFGVRRRRFTA